MKSLIVYFSWSGNTKNIVDSFNKEFNFDTIKIERKIPYSTDYNTCAYIEAKEEWEKKILPEINDIYIEISEYNRILLFFPIWWYTIPMCVATFVKNNLKNFDKEVIVFANSYTNDSIYMSNSMKDIAKLNPGLKLVEGLFNKTIKEHIEFIKEQNNGNN